MRIFFSVALAMFIAAGTACSSRPDQESRLDKIKFDLDKINADGLQGPPDGLRSVSYEFCIPGKYRDAVGRIDPTVEFSKARGRIGCSDDEWLCIGHTHQDDYREVLLRLAALDYVREIREAFFE